MRLTSSAARPGERMLDRRVERSAAQCLWTPSALGLVGDRLDGRGRRSGDTVAETVASPAASGPLDPGQCGRVTHRLAEVLLLCLPVLLAGAESIVGIASVGEKRLGLLRRPRPFQAGAPAHDHLGGTLAALDAVHMASAFPPSLGAGAGQGGRRGRRGRSHPQAARHAGHQGGHRMGADGAQSSPPREGTCRSRNGSCGAMAWRRMVGSGHKSCTETEGEREPVPHMARQMRALGLEAEAAPVGCEPPARSLSPISQPCGSRRHCARAAQVSCNGNPPVQPIGNHLASFVERRAPPGHPA